MGNGSVKLRCSDPSCNQVYGSVTWDDWSKSGTLNKSFGGNCNGEHAPSSYSGNVVNIECATCRAVYARVDSDEWNTAGTITKTAGKCTHHAGSCPLAATRAPNIFNITNTININININNVNLINIKQIIREGRLTNQDIHALEQAIGMKVKEVLANQQQVLQQGGANAANLIEVCRDIENIR